MPDINSKHNDIRIRVSAPKSAIGDHSLMNCNHQISKKRARSVSASELLTEEISSSKVQVVVQPMHSSTLRLRHATAITTNLAGSSGGRYNEETPRVDHSLPPASTSKHCFRKSENAYHFGLFQQQMPSFTQPGSTGQRDFEQQILPSCRTSCIRAVSPYFAPPVKREGEEAFFKVFEDRVEEHSRNPSPRSSPVTIKQERGDCHPCTPFSNDFQIPSPKNENRQQSKSLPARGARPSKVKGQKARRQEKKGYKGIDRQFASLGSLLDYMDKLRVEHQQDRQYWEMRDNRVCKSIEAIRNELDTEHRTRESAEQSFRATLVDLRGRLQQEVRERAHLGILLKSLHEGSQSRGHFES